MGTLVKRLEGNTVKLCVSSPRKLSNIEDSDVYRMLRNQDEGVPHEPRQSGSFKALQSFINSEGTHKTSTVSTVMDKETQKS